MNEVQIFNNSEFGEIRTVIIDGEPWFVARDLSEILGYAQTNHMKRLIDEEDYKTIDPQNAVFSGFLQNGASLEPNKNIRILSITNESGLYAAIFGSKLPNAKKFKKWVTSEVLPSIRKTGSYGQPKLPQTPMELLELHYEAIKQVDKKVDNVSAEVESVRSDLESLKMDLPILPIEAEKITLAVKRKGVNVLGGKDSNAYHNRGLQQKVYRDIYRNIKHNFGDINTYKAIKRSQCEKAVEIIQRYEPPFFLAELIENENAQGKLNI